MHDEAFEGVQGGQLWKCVGDAVFEIGDEDSVFVLRQVLKVGYQGRARNELVQIVVARGDLWVDFLIQSHVDGVFSKQDLGIIVQIQYRAWSVPVL